MRLDEATVKIVAEKDFVSQAQTPWGAHETPCVSTLTLRNRPPRRSAPKNSVLRKSATLAN